jgi:dUTP pyrophosphatase
MNYLEKKIKNLNLIGEILLNLIYYFVNKNTSFKIKLLNENSKPPFKADPGAAGYDIFSTEDVRVKPGERALVSTGISCEFSKNFYLRVAPRSGLSTKCIDVGAGVIDSSYRGEIKVLLINNGFSVFELPSGSKIAQLILERCSDATILVVENLSLTDRGENGFGSTGN